MPNPKMIDQSDVQRSLANLETKWLTFMKLATESIALVISAYPFDRHEEVLSSTKNDEKAPLILPVKFGPLSTANTLAGNKG